MGRVSRSREAKRDLVEIVYRLRSRSRAAAQRFRSTFDEKCRVLSEFPMMGRSREEFGSSLRSIVVAPYLVF